MINTENKMAKIIVYINDKEQEFNEGITIQDIAEQFAPKNNLFVVEKNLEIVQKEEYKDIVVKNGDKVEIVSFFGGG